MVVVVGGGEDGGKVCYIIIITNRYNNQSSLSKGKHKTQGHSLLVGLHSLAVSHLTHFLPCSMLAFAEGAPAEYSSSKISPTLNFQLTIGTKNKQSEDNGQCYLSDPSTTDANTHFKVFKLTKHS